jgi:hypothetical protein
MSNGPLYHFFFRFQSLKARKREKVFIGTKFSKPFQIMRVVGTSLAGSTSQRPVGARTRGFVCVKAREEIFHT